MNLMIYRGNFIIWSLVSIGWFLTTIIFFEIVYGNVDTIAGWTRPEMYVFQGTYFLITFIIWGLLWENMEKFPRLVNTGQVDLYLLRPISAQFMLSFRIIDPSNIADLTAGTILLFYGVKHAGIELSVVHILLFITLLIIGSIYLYSTWFITVCLSFYADRLDNIPHLFPGLRQIWKNPHPFYQGLFRVILTYLIPVTLAATVPVQALLGQFNWLNITILTIAAISTLLCSHLFLQYSLRRYASASS